MTAPVRVNPGSVPLLPSLAILEVQELDPLARRRPRIRDEEDVVGLDVAMDDPLLVRDVQRPGDRAHDLSACACAPRAANSGPRGLALEQSP